MANTELIQSYVRRSQVEGEAQPSRDMTPMLILGVLRKIEQAREAQQQGNATAKGFFLGRATAIIDSLRNDLDLASGSQSARDYEEFYSLIDQCLQNSVTDRSDKWLDMAEDSVGKASSWWTFTQEAKHGLVGHA